MNAFFTRCIKRTTTWAMLLVWLFALGAGVANACLLEKPVSQGHWPTAVSKSDAPSGITAGPRESKHIDGERHHEDASNAPCLKVCDETSASPVMKASNIGIGTPAIVAHVLAWDPQPAIESAPSRMSEVAQAPPTDPPPRVLFVRLAL